MKADLEDFGTGWCGIHVGLKSNEIDQLIAALHELKKEKTHFHFRSSFEGDSGIGDVEIYFQPDDQPSNMEIEASCRVLRSGE